MSDLSASTSVPKDYTPLKRPDRGPIALKHGQGKQLTKGAHRSDEADKLWKAAQDFESVFMFQVLKQMRSTIHTEGLMHGGVGEEIFTGLMDEELAKHMAGRGGAGIAKMMFSQLSRRFGIKEAGEGESTLPDVSEAAGRLQRELRKAQMGMKAVDAAASMKGP